MTTLTEQERELLRQAPDLAGFVVAHPAAGVTHLRQSQQAYMGFGFSYVVQNGRIDATWNEYSVDSRLPDGSIGRLTIGDTTQTVSLTLARLQKWAESLPDDLVQRARRAWAVSTRDLVALRAIVLEAVDPPAPEQPAAPGEQLSLFEEAIAS